MATAGGEVVFAQPCSCIQNLVGVNIFKRQTSEYLKKLCAIRVLKEEKSGRARLIVQPKLLRLPAQDSNEYSPYELRAKR